MSTTAKHRYRILFLMGLLVAPAFAGVKPNRFEGFEGNGEQDSTELMHKTAAANNTEAAYSSNDKLALGNTLKALVDNPTQYSKEKVAAAKDLLQSIHSINPKKLPQIVSLLKFKDPAALNPVQGAGGNSEEKTFLVSSDNDEAVSVGIRGDDLQKLVPVQGKRNSPVFDPLVIANLFARADLNRDPSLRSRIAATPEAKAASQADESASQAKGTAQAKALASTNAGPSSSPSSSPLDFPTAHEREALVGNYVQQANKEIGIANNGGLNATASPVYNAASGPLKAQVQESFKALVKNDAKAASSGENLKILENLVENPDFQKVAEKALGPERAQNMNLAVAGAQISQDKTNDKSVLSKVAESIGGMMGVPSKALTAKTTLGPNGKNSLANVSAKSGAGSKADTGAAGGLGRASDSPLSWIDVALDLSDEKNLRRATYGDPLKEKMREGRKEIQELRSDLASLLQSSLLLKVSDPCSFTLPAQRKASEKTLASVIADAEQVPSPFKGGPEAKSFLGFKSELSQMKMNLQKANTFPAKSTVLRKHLIQNEEFLKKWLEFDPASVGRIRKSAGLVMLHSKMMSCMKPNQSSLSLLIEESLRAQEEEKLKKAEKQSPDGFQQI